MKSIRIHASQAAAGGMIGYVVIHYVDPERLRFDFSPLFRPTRPGSMEILVTQRQMFEVLSGKDLDLSHPTGTICFQPRGEELLIAFPAQADGIPTEYRVWLSEIALGWNMLSDA